jgi:hypothetical protein
MVESSRVVLDDGPFERMHGCGTRQLPRLLAYSQTVNNLAISIAVLPFKIIQ